MGGSVMFDDTLPYQFPWDTEQMYAQVPLTRSQPSHRPVAPNEQAYMPFDQGYGFRPREHGPVPVHLFPEELSYGVNPRSRDQVYRPVQRNAPYFPPQVLPQVQGFRGQQAYFPAGGRGSEPTASVMPVRDNGYGRRQAYGPMIRPMGQASDPRGQYVYGREGFDEPELFWDAQPEDDRAPYYFVRAPSGQQRGERPALVDHASGVPYFVAGRRGMDEGTGTMSRARGSGKDAGLVRNIPVKDGSSVFLAQNDGTKVKEEQQRNIEREVKKELLNKGFLPPGRSTWRTSEGGVQNPESGLLRKGFVTSRGSKPESLATAAPSRSVTSGNGQSDSNGRKMGRVISVPLSEAGNGNLDAVMKAIFDAVYNEGSKSDGEKHSEQQGPKAEKHVVTRIPAAHSREPGVNRKVTRPSVGGEEVPREELSNAKIDQLQSSSKDADKCKGELPVVKAPISEEEAAKRIQAFFKGYSVRRTKPIEKARAVGNVRAKLRELEEQVAKEEAFPTIMTDSKERLKVTEGVMALLLQLDAIQDVHPTVRDLRKSVARDLTLLQDALDSKLREMAVSNASSYEVEMTDPEGSLTVAVLNAASKEVEITSPEANVTVTVSNAFINEAGTSAPEGNITMAISNASSDEAETTPAEGDVTVGVFNAASDETGTTAPEGIVTMAVSNGSSCDAETTAPEGNVKVAGDCVSSEKSEEEDKATVSVVECNVVLGSSIEQATAGAENNFLDGDDRVDSAEETTASADDALLHGEGNTGENVVISLASAPICESHSCSANEELELGSSTPACEPQVPLVVHDEGDKASAQEVEERKLVRQLLEENRHLKAMVQALVGLTESPTRSIEDRLSRLESRVSKSGNARRERSARRVVPRRKQ